MPLKYACTFVFKKSRFLKVKLLCDSYERVQSLSGNT